MSQRRQDLDEVQQRLKEIQHRKRGGIRWHVSRHTAEMAIGALERESPKAKPAPPHGKQRRRKRTKRLL